MLFYRLLLRLYPASFRARYEDELIAVFAERIREFSGPLAILRIPLAAIADVVPNALAVHWEMLIQDLSYAARSLIRAPGFAITAILVAALGVGANTAAFSLADFVLVRPLPFRDSQRLVKLWQATPAYARNVLSPANFRDWREQSRSFESMGAFTVRAANLVGNGDPRRLETILATPELLPIIGVPAMIGRHFTEADAAAGQPVVLSYALWQSQFGSDPAVIGRVVRLNDVPHTVIGVMPASFHFPSRDIEAFRALVLREEDMEERNDTYLQAVGRLRGGVTLEQAREELQVIATRMQKLYPENRDIGALVIPLREEISSNARMLVLALCGAALCILLLSCANLASLFLARGANRARELAIRSALGAGRERLIRQLVTESFAIAVVGGLIGVGLAMISVPILGRLVPSSLPIAQFPTVDLRVLAVAAGFVVLTGLAFGVFPAVRVGRKRLLADLHAGDRSTGGRRQGMRAVLVLLEIIASVVLLVSSGLLIRAIWNLQATEPGFRSEHVLAVRTALPLPRYDAIARREQFFTQVLEGVRALPGVEAAGYVTGLPMDMRGGIWGVTIPGREQTHDGSEMVSLRFVTSQFFNTLQVPLLRGRDVSDSDTAKQPYVAVVSESFARQHFPGEDPIGRQFNVANFDRTIVGIVGDVRVRGLERSSEPQVYLPYRQVPDGGLIAYVPKELVVRSTAAPETLTASIRQIVRRADPEQPLSHVRTLSSIVDNETAPRITQMRLLGLLAAIALLIAGIGVHGLLTYTVSSRSRELGVRRALGAPVSGIVKLVINEGMTLAAVGILIGVLVAYAAARGMSALLVGIRPGDPLTLFAAAAFCFLTVLAGCLRPALRAARLDPWTALRAE